MTERVVLFVCVENACRSLMAEAMFNENPPPGWHALSAGTQPTHAPNPRTEGMLREIGLELPAHPPRLLTDELMRGSHVVVTMGCLDSASCPARLKHLEVRDWALPDPARLDDAGFRGVRTALGARVAQLREELLLVDARSSSPPDPR
jgi:arsenate reductase (thioredoxin)